MAFSLGVRMAIRGKLSQYERSVAVAHTVGIRKATITMKTKGQRAIEQGGLGTKLPHALRGVVFDSHGTDITKRGIDPNPLGIVYSKATVRRQSGPVDLLGVFQAGAVILPRKGRYLAVATKEAGGRRARPMADYPPTTFRITRARRQAGPNRPEFIAIHRVRKEVWYLLFSVVRLRRRYNLDIIYQLTAASIPRLIDETWAKESQKLEAQIGP
jgi:hypothetical protein